jgi:hypothetical protein
MKTGRFATNARAWLVCPEAALGAGFATLVLALPLEPDSAVEGPAAGFASAVLVSSGTSSSISVSGIVGSPPVWGCGSGFLNWAISDNPSLRSSNRGRPFADFVSIGCGTGVTAE